MINAQGGEENTRHDSRSLNSHSNWFRTKQGSNKNHPQIPSKTHKLRQTRCGLRLREWSKSRRRLHVGEVAQWSGAGGLLAQVKSSHVSRQHLSNTALAFSSFCRRKPVSTEDVFTIVTKALIHETRSRKMPAQTWYFFTGMRGASVRVSPHGAVRGADAPL